MKKFHTTYIMLFFSIMLYAYKIDIRIDGLKDSTIYLLRHYGNREFIIDTGYVNNHKQASFIGDGNLESGIYMAFFGNGKYVEFLVDDDWDFTLTSDTSNFIEHLEISGAEESEKFLAHQRSIIEKQKLISYLSEALKQLPSNDSRRKEVQQKLAETKREIEFVNDRFIDQNRGSFAASVVKATIPIKVPEFDIPVETPKRDSLLWITSLNYYQNHYFDNINLGDDRILNTPLLFGKLDTYFNRILLQHPDSIKVALDRLLNAKINSEIKNFILGYLYTLYNRQEKFGFEDILLHLYQNHGMINDEIFIDYMTFNDVKHKIEYLKNVSIGNIAPNITLFDTVSEKISLYDIEAKFTILIFWNPECGHCSEELKQLKTFYKMHRGTYEIYAVYTQTDKDIWREDLKLKNYQWINVYDPEENSKFKEIYQVYYTPRLYLLDQNKKILAKSSSANDIIEYFKNL